MMSDPFLGEIRMVGFNFAPRGWAFCQGQLMSIQQNSALYSLLGTQYGGNGQTTFALPDLRGRTPVGFGQGPGLSNVALGETAGVESVAVQTSHMPAHSHSLNGANLPVSVSGQVAMPASTATATAASPVNAVPASSINSGRPFPMYSAEQSGSDTLKPFAVSLSGELNIPATETAAVGGSLPLPVRNPYLGSNFIIALEGIYPSRD